jgi:small subunit ribosomal protein S2
LGTKQAAGTLKWRLKTVEALEKALIFLNDTAAGGKQVLLVSTKRQAKDKVKEVAGTTNMPYVVERWLGGMLTNQATISGRIKHLKDLETRMVTGELAARYSKLEVQRFQEEIDALNHLYGGIKELAAKPGAVFVVDVLNDINAVREARKLHIPVVALTDTNVDPSLVDYSIPCNDDATKTIDLVLEYVQAAILAGKSKTAKVVDKTEKSEEKPKPKKEEAKEEK